MMIENPDLNSLTDEALCDLVRKSNREALITIYDRYSENLYIYILRVVSTNNRSPQLENDTKQILIQVFESLWAMRSNMPKDTPLKNYLFNTAIHHATNYNPLFKPAP